MRALAVQDVRCPRCQKKLGENLIGTITIKCPGCKSLVVLDTRGVLVVKV